MIAIPDPCAARCYAGTVGRSIALWAGLLACTPNADEAVAPPAIAADPDPVPPLPPSASTPVRAEAPDAESVPVWMDPRTCARGRADARADAKAGSMRALSWGYTEPCTAEYWQWLAERYHVHTDDLGCTASQEQVDHTLHPCYRDEVDTILKERHGADILARLDAKADAICRAQEDARIARARQHAQ